ncbi:uncharacterized protein LOC117285390 [Fukomys damarensis]|uniref:uncharacterized protein LOC117285390 n=1 Tax=Fukomys damarensis TaxID=885580 RepID=UPI001455D2E3|nr:uncharacterized protein LOC117285390 [Fukomys damarensis]
MVLPQRRHKEVPGEEGVRGRQRPAGKAVADPPAPRAGVGARERRENTRQQVLGAGRGCALLTRGNCRQTGSGLKQTNLRNARPGPQPTRDWPERSPRGGGERECARAIRVRTLTSAEGDVRAGAAASRPFPAPGEIYTRRETSPEALGGPPRFRLGQSCREGILRGWNDLHPNPEVGASAPLFGSVRKSKAPFGKRGSPPCPSLRLFRLNEIPCKHLNIGEDVEQEEFLQRLGMCKLGNNSEGKKKSHLNLKHNLMTESPVLNIQS